MARTRRHFGFQFRVHTQNALKYIDSSRTPVEFSYLDSYVMKFGGFTRAIEWMDIDPIKREYVGQLIAHREKDFSNWLREALISFFIPFVEVDGLFRINGYLQTA